MSGNIIPLTPPSPAAVPATAAAPAPLETWGRPPQQPQGGAQMQRMVSVLRRFRWLILAMTLLGTAIGVVATRFVDPVYAPVTPMLAVSIRP